MTTMQVIGVGWRAARQAARQHRAERGSRVRSLAAAVLERGLAIAGLGCFTVAAAMIAVPLGLAVAGISFFILDWTVGE